MYVDFANCHNNVLYGSGNFSWRVSLKESERKKWKSPWSSLIPQQSLICLWSITLIFFFFFLKQEQTSHGVCPPSGLSQVFSLLKSAHVLWTGLLEMWCVSACILAGGTWHQFISSLVRLTSNTAFQCRFWFSHCKAMLFPFVINKHVVGRYFATMEIRCLPSHFLSHWSQCPLMILTQINYYDGCQVIIFKLHPFFDICLFMFYIFFFFKKLPPFPYI